MWVNGPWPWRMNDLNTLNRFFFDSWALILPCLANITYVSHLKSLMEKCKTHSGVRCEQKSGLFLWGGFSLLITIFIAWQYLKACFLLFWRASWLFCFPTMLICTLMNSLIVQMSGFSCWKLSMLLFLLHAVIHENCCWNCAHSLKGT